MNKLLTIPAFLLLILLASFQAQHGVAKKNPYYNHGDKGKLRVANEEWKKILPDNVYVIMREKGTEAPETGPYVHNNKKGTYYCVACGNPLFTSATKFDSHTGWPSFYKPIAKDAVIELKDNTAGMTRTEIECARCGGHLGHLFDDGPAPTGLRYCMNGFALTFEGN